METEKKSKERRNEVVRAELVNWREERGEGSGEGQRKK